VSAGEESSDYGRTKAFLNDLRNIAHGLKRTVGDISFVK
jgi:hypothetical protein